MSEAHWEPVPTVRQRLNKPGEYRQVSDWAADASAPDKILMYGIPDSALFELSGTQLRVYVINLRQSAFPRKERTECRAWVAGPEGSVRSYWGHTVQTANYEGAVVGAISKARGALGLARPARRGPFGIVDASCVDNCETGVRVLHVASTEGTLGGALGWRRREEDTNARGEWLAERAQRAGDR